MPVIRWIALLALAACDGEDGGGPGPRDAAPDAPGDSAVEVSDAGLDAGPDAAADAGCETVRVDAPIVADTQIVADQPGLNWGNSPIMNVGVGIDSAGLFRFDVAALPLGADVRDARVVLTPAATSSACASSCGDCGPIEADGELSLLYLRADWNELEATWSSRVAGGEWGSPGARTPNVDRSRDIASHLSHVARSAETFEIAPERLGDLDRWRSESELAFVLLPSSGAVMVLATRESASEACTPGGYAPPRLEIDYCP